MTDWQIEIPYRARSDELIDVAAATRALPEGEKREVAQQLVLNAAMDGMTTAGELLDYLEAADPAERRALLDRARAEWGLDTTVEIERRQDHARAMRWPPPFRPRNGHRDRDGAAFQTCCQPGCMSFSADSEGRPSATTARRWACELHRSEGDFRDWEEPIRLDALGLPEISHDAERHYENTYEQAVREGNERTEERAAESARLAELERRHRSGLVPEPGFGG